MCDYYLEVNIKSLNQSEKEQCENYEIMSNIKELQGIYADKEWKYEVCWNKLFKAYLFRDIRFPAGKIHEDSMTTYKLLYKSNYKTIINDKLYHYYQSDYSIIREEFNRKRLDLIEVMSNRVLLFKEVKLNNLQYKAEVVLQKILVEFYYECCKLKSDSKLKYEVKRTYNKNFIRIFLIDTLYKKREYHS